MYALRVVCKWTLCTMPMLIRGVLSETRRASCRRLKIEKRSSSEVLQVGLSAVACSIPEI